MIADSALVPSENPPERAAPRDLAPREIWDAIEANPELLEPGFHIVARDLPLGGRTLLPLLGIDAGARAVLVVGPRSPGDDVFPLAVDAWIRFAQARPLLEKIAEGLASTAHEGPRLVVLAPTPVADLAERFALLRDVPSEILRVRGLTVGDRDALLFEPVTAAHAAPARPVGVAPPTDPGRRLLEDARARILGLSPEIAAVERGGALVLCFRDRDLALLRARGPSLELTVSGDPEPRRILGRTDLDTALRDVIEDFFAAYSGDAIAPNEPTSSAAHPTNDVRSARSSPPPPPPPRPARFDPPRPTTSGARADEGPGEGPFASMPLTREEIEEFLRSEGDTEG